MQNVLFLQNKLKRQICLNGQDLVFKKVIEDNFHQSVESEEEVVVKGIYHEAYSYAKSQDSDAARMVKKPQPMVLMLFEDGSKIEKDFSLMLGGSKYKVTAKHNVKNLDVAYDVSLELVL